ncbi:GNAT family N-acetyltransferase [Aeromicrobium wangtongii]|uniref:GNAT family N-acetyltransferase n=1 Tax=Aeromicrobium wangtongii TaxID=2969247 RepID=UPI00201816E3|nr:GNAT family N-acetyltransferase [Aeromicrobium wangtongii]MCL3818521.1 GNAT family N-acetyltransferase [Aeromicrobium wangtongii]
MSARPHVVLRDAEREDAAALIALWAECFEASQDEGSEAFTQQALWREPGVAEAATALELNLSRPDKRIILALVDGEIIGATVCDVGTLTPISLTRVLIVTEIQVSPRYRRKSVALTLLSAAASYGEEHNCEIVIAAIPAHSREPHRYLTKIGFNQIAVLRAIQSSKLRSRLTSKATNSRDTGKLIAVRRTLRRRQSHARGSRPPALGRNHTVGGDD